jgi:hypothetical protein
MLVVAGATTMALMVDLPAGGRAAGTAGQPLAPSRSATYAAVLAAVAEDPQATVVATPERFAAFYAAADDAFRAWAAGAIDAIEAETGSFAGLAPADAHRLLATWQAAGARADPRAAIAADALALAGLHFEEDELRQPGPFLRPLGR